MEYWDPKALYKGCSTCPCERPNVQSYYQSGTNILTNPFRSVQQCSMGEKSNAILPYSQVIMLLCPNHAKMSGAYDADNKCPICGVNIADIKLPTQTSHSSNTLRANEVYYYAKAEFYEPVLIEPLTFTCGSEFNPPMWKLDNFELTYNIDDYTNMLEINKALILSKFNREEQKNGEGGGTATDKRRSLCA